ncbi:uncharacterized protein LOC142768276 [Rhipicephalus microplus]|uniref:uncharacterized protein LOC142768276 n=1 Tax=Rhipicephalus microplus TaxID=6941 RepID=UPI003F6AB410
MSSRSARSEHGHRHGLRLRIGRRRKIPASPHQQRTRSSAPAQRGGLDSAIRRLPRSALPRMTRDDSDDTGPQARTAPGDSVVCNAFPMHDAALVRRLKAPAFVNAGDPDTVSLSIWSLSPVGQPATSGEGSRLVTRRSRGGNPAARDLPGSL